MPHGQRMLHALPRLLNTPCIYATGSGNRLQNSADASVRALLPWTHDSGH